MNELYKEILRIRNEKREKNIYPDYALQIEIRLPARLIELQAEELEFDGIITIGRTVNYTYYRLTEEE